MGDQLTIRPCKIRRRRHCLEVSLPFRRVNGGARELTVGQMQAVSSHRLVQLSNEVRANLMTQAARTRVDQHHDALLGEIVLGCGFFMEDLIHILHFQKMIARPEGCKLRFPTLFGARADGMRISPGNAAAFFCMIEIGLGSHVVFKGPLGTLFEDTIEVIVGNIQPAGLADSGWNVAKQLMHQIAKLGPDFLQCQISAQKTNAAIDIKTDAAGRDNAILLVDRGNTSNGKAVALMNIRHCKGSADDAGKHRNVGCLFEGLIAADGFEQWLARVHKSVREHSGFIGPWNQPAIIVDLFQVHIKRLRTPGSPNHPGPDDFRIDDTSRL